MLSMNGFNSSPCGVLLPEDIIFLIIAPMVCDLSNSCILDSRGENVKFNYASDFMISKTGREMMMLQLPCCWKKLQPLHYVIWIRIRIEIAVWIELGMGMDRVRDGRGTGVDITIRFNMDMSKCPV